MYGILARLEPPLILIGVLIGGVYTGGMNVIVRFFTMLMCAFLIMLAAPLS